MKTRFKLPAALALLLAALAQAHAQSHGQQHGQPHDARAGECPATEVAPYRGPLFDAMFEMDESEPGDSLLAMAQQHGVRHLAVFAFVHGEHLMYGDRGNVAAVAARHRDVITLGAPKLANQRDDLSEDYLRGTLEGAAHGDYHFVGEILYRHGDKFEDGQTKWGEIHVDPFAGGTARLLDGLAGRRVPVMAHWEVYRWGTDRPVFDRLYSRFPGQTFIWPHLGFGSPEQVSQMFAANPNLVGTISSKLGPMIGYRDRAMGAEAGSGMRDDCQMLRPEWRAVFERFPDRLLFASDVHTKERFEKYPRMIGAYRHLLGQLPSDLATAIAFRNAERTYGVRLRAD